MLWNSKRETSGGGPKIVDDFEDSDVSEYGGDTGNVSFTTSNVQNGSVALELSNSNANQRSISSTSGLDNYPSAGDTFRCWTRMGTNGQSKWEIMFATQSATAFSNRYSIFLNRDGSDFAIVKDDGSFSFLSSATQTYSYSTYYEVEVDWSTNGDIKARLFDSSGSKLNSVSTNDTTYSSGGIGFSQNTPTGGDTTTFDYYRII